MDDAVTTAAVVPQNWDWQVRGACRGLSSATFFSPENERGRARRMREAGAKSVCAACPVVAMCLEWALSVREPFGIWGGTTPDERAEMLAVRDLYAAS